MTVAGADSGTFIRIVWERVFPLASNCAGVALGVEFSTGAGMGFSSPFFLKSNFGGRSIFP